MGSAELPYKGYGRIYCIRGEKDVPKVRAILATIDPDEMSYMPKDMVAGIEEYPRHAYVHKFDIHDTPGFVRTCKEQGCPVWIYAASDSYAMQEPYHSRDVDDACKTAIEALAGGDATESERRAAVVAYLRALGGDSELIADLYDDTTPESERGEAG